MSNLVVSRERFKRLLLDVGRLVQTYHDETGLHPQVEITATRVTTFSSIHEEYLYRAVGKVVLIEEEE